MTTNTHLLSVSKSCRHQCCKLTKISFNEDKTDSSVLASCLSAVVVLGQAALDKRITTQGTFLKNYHELEFDGRELFISTCI